MVVRGDEGRGMGDKGQRACSPATAPVTFVPPHARLYPPHLFIPPHARLVLIRPPHTCSYHPQLFVPCIPALVCAPVLICTPCGCLVLVCTPALPLHLLSSLSSSLPLLLLPLFCICQHSSALVHVRQPSLLPASWFPMLVLPHRHCSCCCCCHCCCCHRWCCSHCCSHCVYVRTPSCWSSGSCVSALSSICGTSAPPLACNSIISISCSICYSPLYLGLKTPAKQNSN
jgi:hypothetical protein